MKIYKIILIVICLFIIEIVIAIKSYPPIKSVPVEIKVDEEEVEEKKASITKYLWTGNKMANGEYPHIGAVASSDRTILFGTKVIIEDIEYIVKDRTALWVHEKYGLTFDIYTEETKNQALIFGRQNKIIKILIN